eukprot:gene298-6712_t
MKTPTLSRLKTMNKENNPQVDYYSPATEKIKKNEKTKIENNLLLVNHYFYIEGYAKKLTSMITENIEYFNGTIVDQIDGCTFFVTPFLHDINGDEFKYTSTEFIFCTIQYIDSCITEKEILDINSNIIFKPFKSVEGIETFKNLKICITGFKESERDDMIYLIRRTGAFYSPDLKENINILISLSPEGNKYEFAVKKNIPIVSKKWLIDSLSHWEKKDTLSYLMKSKNEK